MIVGSSEDGPNRKLLCQLALKNKVPEAIRVGASTQRRPEKERDSAFGRPSAKPNAPGPAQLRVELQS